MVVHYKNKHAFQLSFPEKPIVVISHLLSFNDDQLLLQKCVLNQLDCHEWQMSAKGPAWLDNLFY